MMATHSKCTNYRESVSEQLEVNGSRISGKGTWKHRGSLYRLGGKWQKYVAGSEWVEDKSEKFWGFDSQDTATVAFRQIVDDGYYAAPTPPSQRKRKPQEQEYGGRNRNRGGGYNPTPQEIEAAVAQSSVIDGEENENENENKQEATPQESSLTGASRRVLEWLKSHGKSSTSEISAGLGPKGYEGLKRWRKKLESLNAEGMVYQWGTSRCRWTITKTGLQALEGVEVPCAVVVPPNKQESKQEANNQPQEQGKQTSQQEQEVIPGEKVGENNQELAREVANLLKEEIDKLRQEQETLRQEQEVLKEEIGKTQTKEIVVKEKGKDDRKVEGHCHPQFELVLRLAKQGRNIMLVGPTGSGKSHMGDQIAKVMFDDNDKFSAISFVDGMPPSNLTGRMVLNEQGGMIYRESALIRLVRNGGIFLGDEMDNADPNTLLIVNTLLANGYIVIPETGEKVTCHPDFVFIATCNTYGRGADRLYVGRNQLDEATIDRFRMGLVELEYDKSLETSLCPHEGLREKLWAIREKVTTHRLERVVSTRFIKEAYEEHLAGSDHTWIVGQLVQGWSKDELAYVGMG